MKKPVVLTIIDGLGYSSQVKGNAWKQAKTPILDDFLAKYPNSVIKASGNAVGLPEGQIGNSEVGHLNIGAGQVVFTGLSLIQKALDDKSFYKNKALLKSIEHAKKNNSTVHVMGLLSPGGVHSIEKHAFEIIEMLSQNQIKNATFHAFADGRDVAPRSVEPSIKKLTNLLQSKGYKLGSIQGRLYAMDRDSNFDKTELAFNTLRGNANNKFTNVFEYVKDQYNKDLNDEFIEPATNQEPGVKFLQDNDSVIFFNFRPDRARQIAHLIIGSNIYKQKPEYPVKNVQLTSMMKYEDINKADVAFDSMLVQNPIGKVISENGLTQLRIAETQKYAHVTFFMDGGQEVRLPGADRKIVDSVKVDDFSEVPEMSAKKITDNLLPVLQNYDLVIMNYANPDMVGHTGNLESAIKAVEVVDFEISRIKKELEKIGGTLFITADHGNAEIMLDKNNKKVTKHTTSDVPFICSDLKIKLKNGALANIAPTILDYMGIKKPKSMDQESLLIK